jgi:hypothetical protein
LSDPSAGEHAGRMKFRPFAARRARKAADDLALIEQRAWWRQRYSAATEALRKRRADRVSVQRRRIEDDREAGIIHVRVPGSKLMAPCQIVEAEVVPVDDAWVHRTGEDFRMVAGRWSSTPYRNPARAAKLAKAGRLRPDLDDAGLREGLARIRKDRPA